MVVAPFLTMWFSTGWPVARHGSHSMTEFRRVSRRIPPAFCWPNICIPSCRKTEFGTGPFTQSGEVTVGSTPVAPARVGAWKEGGNIHVLWDLVQMPAGVTFQYYQIQYREVGVGDWSTIGTDLQ